MLHRRDFLLRTLRGSSLLAVGSVVPQFIADTARAAESGKDTVLVVVEMTGGNDGLNTVIPYADDLYHKNRPTLRKTREQVLRVDDVIGLHPSLGGLYNLFQQKQLAIVQGVGYPNPDRSHFESMDVWQSGDPKRAVKTGWVGRTVPTLQAQSGGNVPALHLGDDKLPLALQGAPGGVISLNDQQPYRLELHGDADRQKARRKLLEDLSGKQPADKEGLAAFVQKRQVQTYASLDRIQKALSGDGQPQPPGAPLPPPPAFVDNNLARGQSLTRKLNLIGRLIRENFGTRVYYVSIDGFDTHSGQAEAHEKLLSELGNAIQNFFNVLGGKDGHAQRVVLMTFSEFGRRVKENGSKGTDHGAASCMFVAGPSVASGAVTKHPSLADLDSGDLKYHTDFRRVYATLLDQWLGVDSETVLNARFEHLPLLAKKG